MRRNPRVSWTVDRCANDYRTTYRPVIIVREESCHRSWNDNHRRYDNWRQHGFCGGFWWDFRPVYDVDQYFWNPTVTYFYSNTWDDDYYRTWYGSDYDTTPVLRTPNPQVGVFYPTEDFLSLNVAVSSLTASQQGIYRTQMNNLVDWFQQILSYSQQANVVLANGDVVINHFQVLPGGKALVLEGFVNNDSTQYQFPFKTLVSLEDAEAMLLFIPSTVDGTATDDDLAQLQQLNDTIVQMGGVVEFGDEL